MISPKMQRLTPLETALCSLANGYYLQNVHSTCYNKAHNNVQLDRIQNCTAVSLTETSPGTHPIAIWANSRHVPGIDVWNMPGFGLDWVCSRTHFGKGCLYRAVCFTNMCWASY